MNIKQKNSGFQIEKEKTQLARQLCFFVPYVLGSAIQQCFKKAHIRLIRKYLLIFPENAIAKWKLLC
jgi:hypothetical protein